MPGATIPPGPADQARSLTPTRPPAWDPPTDPSARLLPPGSGSGKPGRLEPAPRSPSTPPPPEAPRLEVDVPGFTVVKKQVASGQKPFADGLTWLREKGYRTVVHLRTPGEDDTAHRRQFEARGFRYISLELSPDTLTRDIVDQFNHIVTDQANLPLYVYDRDGALAGGLWYLHFRIIDGLSRQDAIRKAAPLGLNPDADGGTQKEMWLAIQKYLSMSKS